MVLFSMRHISKFSRLLGLVAVAVAFALLSGGFVFWYPAIQQIVLSASSAIVHKAELNYVSFSPRGEGGGSIIPASCESGYSSHIDPTTGTTTCLMYQCRGPIIPPAQVSAWQWEWWKAGSYSCVDVGDGQQNCGYQWEYAGPGTGWCTDPTLPPPPANITYACNLNNTATISWSAVPQAEYYYPRVVGMTLAECQALGQGWGWGTDNQTCYYNGWLSSSSTNITIPTRAGASYYAYVHSGDPFNQTSVHTGVFSCGSNPPNGEFQSIQCGAPGLTGWACDQDNFSRQIQVKVYADGSLVGTALANKSTSLQIANQCGGYAGHGFEFAIPESLKDDGSHSYQVYAVDYASSTSQQLADQLLAGGPKSQTCSPTAPAGSVPTADIWAQSGTFEVGQGVGGGTLSMSAGDVTIYWASTGADSCVATQGTIDFVTGGMLNGSDNTITEPLQGNTQRFAISCDDADLNTLPGTDYVDVFMTSPGSAPAWSVTDRVRNGQSATISVTSLGGNGSCTITGPGAGGGTLGNTTYTIFTTASWSTAPLTTNSTYTITCNLWNGASLQETVYVEPALNER